MKTLTETLATLSPETDEPVMASPANFPPLEAMVKATPPGSLDHLLDVSVSVTAELGRATMSIGDILKISLGSVVGLNRGVTEPVELFVQGVSFARGEVVVVDDRFAIRIKEIVDPAQQGKK